MNSNKIFKKFSAIAVVHRFNSKTNSNGLIIFHFYDIANIDLNFSLTCYYKIRFCHQAKSVDLESNLWSPGSFQKTNNNNLT